MNCVSFTTLTMCFNVNHMFKTLALCNGNYTLLSKHSMWLSMTCLGRHWQSPCSVVSVWGCWLKCVLGMLFCSTCTKPKNGNCGMYYFVILTISTKWLFYLFMQSNGWITDRSWILMWPETCFKLWSEDPLHEHKITRKRQPAHTVMEEGDTTPRHIWVHSSCPAAQQENSSPARRRATDSAPAPSIG